MGTSVTAPTTAAPLQQRTAAQLQDGLHIDVFNGAPPAKDGAPEPPKPEMTWDTLAASRLVQDAADYVATTSGVKPSLGKFYLGDADPRHSTWAGYAQFSTPKDGKDAVGAFTLTKGTADDLMAGIQRLKTTPFTQWSAHEQSSFASAQETILHELGHVTLPAYDAATLKSWDNNWRTNHTLEEGLTELGAQQDLPGFFKQEFGTDLPANVADDTKTMSVYRRWTTGLTRLFHMEGIPDDQMGTYAKKLGDATYPGSRAGVIAKAIVAQHGGDPEGSDGKMTRVVSGAIRGFVNEIPGSGGQMQLATDALDDIHAGRTVDTKAFDASLAEMKRISRDGWNQRHDEFKPNVEPGSQADG